MGVRTVVELSITAGFGASDEDTIFERDYSQTDDTLDHATAYRRTLAALDADVEVVFAGITDVRLVYIEADGDITIKFHGTGGSSLSLERPIDPASATAGEKTAVFCANISPASIHLTNPSATDAVHVRVLLVGDLAA